MHSHSEFNFDHLKYDFKFMDQLWIFKLVKLPFYPLCTKVQKSKINGCKMECQQWDTIVVDYFTLLLKGSWLVDQFAMGWEDSTCEGNSLDGKSVIFPAYNLTFVVFPAHSWPSFQYHILMILVSLESSWCLLSSVTNIVRSWAWISELQPWEWGLPEWFSWRWVICQSKFRSNRRSFWRSETH